MWLGVNKGSAWNDNNSFIRTTTCAGRQLADGLWSDVFSDYSEVARFKFENIGASPYSWRLHSIEVRVGTDSA